MSAFDTAVADSKKLTSKPGNEDLLKLYGKSLHDQPLYTGARCGRQTVTNMTIAALFKVANGEDISKAPAPGMFDLKGKAKKNAWQQVVDEGTTPDQAKEQYIQLVESLKESCGYDANKEPEAVGA
ncbi:putative acyl-CoA-binding protein like protein [Emericellopsis atlantica]|uniref:Acyl-CoA-binding protein like protein n=1 Tax=Emericellopsis atlantica TaxID=2614577 RepID=A0A9P8CUD8_9HYPO|nr:putative acyl-CoA-binding protein like protein [Emericellopsis atlantica]KAG9259092.1 putative acyl-CoA-binding protein like protein [Emericellopsis atlantica]